MAESIHAWFDEGRLESALPRQPYTLLRNVMDATRVRKRMPAYDHAWMSWILKLPVCS
jgi:hypothetical protein